MSLMSYEEYAKIEPKVPYAITIRSEDSYLYYFGERHSYDPKNPQWEELKKFWDDFLKQTEGQSRIAFIEGGNPPTATNEEEAILKYGGGGLVAYLAKESDIPTFSPEPNETIERAELEKKFSREVIQYYYFARVVHQWGLQNPKPDFWQYITRYLDGDKRNSGWNDFDFSLDNMRAIHQKLFNNNSDEEDQKFMGDVSNPISQETEVNKVSRASSEIRDLHIIEMIKKYLIEGYSIFSVYGYSHVVMQEPLLREILNKGS
jgi:hypothetical protein